MAPYSNCALARLRRSISASPPSRFSHLNTRPATYQANVGGVFCIERASATTR